MERFTKPAAGAISEALESAQRLGHTYVGSEHLLLGILRQSESIGARMLLSRGITFEKAEKKVAALVGKGSLTNLSAGDMTPRARHIIAQAFCSARECGGNVVGTEHLLDALLAEGQSTAGAVLSKLGTEPQGLRQTVGERLKMGEATLVGGKAPKLLQKYAVCLTCGLSAPASLIGREQESERLMSVLCRRQKNNPCLIGPPGVGKTALVEGLAASIVRGEVPKGLRGKQVWRLELGGMVAGSKYRGEFEERIMGVVEECEKNPDILLFIDEVHTLMGAGAAEGAVDAANILKPALSRGRIRLIGATTDTEYRKHIEKDAALERRLTPIYVKASSAEDTEEILESMLPGLAEHHNVEIGPDLPRKAVALAGRYFPARAFPDSAIDLLDEACSLTGIRLPQEQWNEEERCPMVEESALWAVVSRATGVPIGQLTRGERERLTALEKALSQRVLGQDKAVKALAGALRAARLLPRQGRPQGAFLLAGPSGVGKTETARVVADTLFEGSRGLIRLDMSEYAERHTVASLIGAPAGYIGYGEGGRLTEAVRRNPYAVVLFDELEKAHPDVSGILLQILEEGMLTDSEGKKADFTGTLILITTNLGANKKGIGFEKEPDADGLRASLSGFFRPELLGRLDDIIPFVSLGKKELHTLARRYLSELEDQLSAQGSAVHFDETVVDYVAAAPDTAGFGARPLRARVEGEIKRAVTEWMLKGSLAEEISLQDIMGK